MAITTTDFQVCLKDIQRYDAHHDPITLNYMAAGCKYPCGFDVQIVLIVCSLTKPKVRIVANGHRKSSHLIKYIYNKVSHTTRAPIG